MKRACECAVREVLAKRLATARKCNRMTQEEFSEALMVNLRTYSDNEHGITTCCTLSFIIYFAFYCEDPADLASELRRTIAKTIHSTQAFS